MAKGYIIIFEGDGPLVDERHPSAVVHKTREQADVAFKRGDQVGTPLKIIEITWDDTAAKRPWPP
jgi:CTP:molybdopterin cytidylyltransferase MocA